MTWASGQWPSRPGWYDMARNKNNDFLQKVLGWMFLGLLISALGAYAVISTPAITAVVMNPWVFWPLLIAEVLLVIGLSFAIKKISPEAAIAAFLIYALFTGLTISLILMAYAAATIALAFVTAAGMFGAAALYGFYTKKDLSTLGLVLFMALIGVIIASLVNIFVQSSGFSMLLNYLIVIIFAGLTAYDLQQLKSNKEKGDMAKKAAIIGALMLYLNFINMFLALLQIFGDRE